jgi:hypothetical protein
MVGVRHTHFTDLLREGVHPKIASKRTDHASAAITMDIDSHAVPGQPRRAGTATPCRACRKAQHCVLTARFVRFSAVRLDNRWHSDSWPLLGCLTY